jgi:hypothetical protein
MTPAARLVVGSSTTSEARRLFARFTTPPTTARRALINDLISSLKKAAVWAKLDAFYVLAAADTQAAQRNWVQDANNLTLVNAPTFTADRGYAGNGTTSYLDTSFNPSTAGGKLVLDNHHVGAWSRTDSVHASALIGAASAGPANHLRIAPRTSAGNDGNYGLSAALTTVAAAGWPDSSGHYVARRSASNAVALWRNGASFATGTTASTGLSNANIFVGAVSVGGTPAVLSTRQIAAAHFGAGLTDTDIAALYAALRTYMTAVGA